MPDPTAPRHASSDRAPQDRASPDRAGFGSAAPGTASAAASDDSRQPDWPLPELLKAALAHWEDAPRLRLLARDLEHRTDAGGRDLLARVQARLRDLPPEPVARPRVIRRDPAFFARATAAPLPETPTPEMAALLRQLQLERASGDHARQEAATLRQRLSETRAQAQGPDADAALRRDLEAARNDARRAREEATRLAERLAFASSPAGRRVWPDPRPDPAARPDAGADGFATPDPSRPDAGPETGPDAGHADSRRRGPSGFPGADGPRPDPSARPGPSAGSQAFRARPQAGAFGGASRPGANPSRPQPLRRAPPPDPAYAELGLSPDMPDDLVPVMERALLRHHHPDRAPPEERDAATLRFQAVTHAFQRIRKLRGL